MHFSVLIQLINLKEEAFITSQNDAKQGDRNEQAVL